MPKEIVTSATAPTTGFTNQATPSPLAQGIRWGDMLFVSGQGPLNPETREVVSTDIEEQTRQTLINLEGVFPMSELISGLERVSDTPDCGPTEQGPPQRGAVNQPVDRPVRRIQRRIRHG